MLRASGQVVVVFVLALLGLGLGTLGLVRMLGLDFGFP